MRWGDRADRRALERAGEDEACGRRDVVDRFRDVTRRHSFFETGTAATGPVAVGTGVAGARSGSSIDVCTGSNDTPAMVSWPGDAFSELIWALGRALSTCRWMTATGCVSWRYQSMSMLC